MYTIKKVKAKENFIISAVFINGVIKEYDMKTLFKDIPQFQDFENIPGLFEHVQVDVGGYGISWNDELDLAANEIWANGIVVGKEEVEIAEMVASEIMRARASVGMTQKQLSEVTGVDQSDISRIERGLANPSLSTLKKLADGMKLKLLIEFES